MEVFIVDALDLPAGADQAASATQFISADGSSLRASLLDSPALAANLAFHDAWHAACGVRATRFDAADFASKMASTLGRTTGGVEAAQATITRLSPVRVMPRALGEEALRRAGEAYVRAAGSLAVGGRATARRMLVAKLADRFGADAASSAAASAATSGLVAVYADLVRADPCLAPLERWAYASKASNDAPRTVEEYYARVGEAADILGIPWRRSPLSGSQLTCSVSSRTSSCVELMRLAIARDGYLARVDSGGALLLLSPSEPSSLRSDAVFRTAVAPALLVLRALPSFLYRRVVLGPGHEVDDDTTPERHAPVDVEVLRVGARLALSPWPPSEPGIAWLPSTSCTFGSGDPSPPWGEALLHALVTCCLRHGHADSGGEALARAFVTRYAWARRLGAAKHPGLADAAGSGGSLGEVMLVDDRANVWSALSVLITLDNLDTTDGKWSATVFTSARAKPDYERWLLPHAPALRIQELPELPGDRSFDTEKYNTLLKSATFWRRINAPRTLVVQEDGMLVRPGLELDAELMSQAFAGAPWAPRIGGQDNWATLRAAGVGDNLVGNGGMSLRRTASAVAACEAGALDGSASRLFNEDLQPLPEDVFFAAAAEAGGGQPCPQSAAARLSYEEALPPAGVEPFGFHKPWAYLPSGEVAQALGRALIAAAAR
jgi:hypothetical protein